MWSGFELIATNLGLSGFDILVIIVTNILLTILLAKDISVYFMGMLVVNGMEAYWFYLIGWNWTIPLTLALVSVACLSLSILYESLKFRGGVIQ